MKHTHAMVSSRTHLTSIRDSDAGARFWRDFFRLSHKKEGTVKDNRWKRKCEDCSLLRDPNTVLSGGSQLFPFTVIIILSNYAEGPRYYITEKVARVWANLLSLIWNWVQNDVFISGDRIKTSLAWTQWYKHLPPSSHQAPAWHLNIKVEKTKFKM